jgi:hypothetical protein
VTGFIIVINKKQIITIKGKMNIGIILMIVVLLTITCFIACMQPVQKLETHYLKEGKLCHENIAIDFIDKAGNVRSPYIDTVKFGYLNSLSFPENNANHYETNTTTHRLDFSKKIKPYSPEYYSVYSLYHIIKVIEYYNDLFDYKIDFNYQEKYKTIEIVFGDIPFLTRPDFYILTKYSNPSPTLFAHEIGHRAFRYIEDELGVKFRGLSIVHMGLLEYFTLSLYDTPVACEGSLPGKLARNATQHYSYPPDSTLNMKSLLQLIEKTYQAKLKNPQNNISKYIAAFHATYNGRVLGVIDNHRGGMILASTLWRIREQAGLEKIDRLAAQTILNLNAYLEKRADFYQSPEPPEPDKIEWYDVFYGLIQKDRELFDGKDIQIIRDEFAKTGYPVSIIAPM